MIRILFWCSSCCTCIWTYIWHNRFFVRCDGHFSVDFGHHFGLVLLDAIHTLRRSLTKHPQRFDTDRKCSGPSHQRVRVLLHNVHLLDAYVILRSNNLYHFALYNASHAVNGHVEYNVVLHRILHHVASLEQIVLDSSDVVFVVHVQKRHGIVTWNSVDLPITWMDVDMTAVVPGPYTPCTMFLNFMWSKRNPGFGLSSEKCRTMSHMVPCSTTIVLAQASSLVLPPHNLK